MHTHTQGHVYPHSHNPFIHKWKHANTDAQRETNTLCALRRSRSVWAEGTDTSGETVLYNTGQRSPSYTHTHVCVQTSGPFRLDIQTRDWSPVPAGDFTSLITCFLTLTAEIITPATICKPSNSHWEQHIACCYWKWFSVEKLNANFPFLNNFYQCGIYLKNWLPHILNCKISNNLRSTVNYRKQRNCLKESRWHRCLF